MAFEGGVAFGTQAMTLDEEHILASLTAEGIYMLTPDLREMGSEEAVELRLYSKTLADDTDPVLVYQTTYIGVQGDGAAPGDSAQGEISKESPPVRSPHLFVPTLKQIAGGALSIRWRADRV